MYPYAQSGIAAARSRTAPAVAHTNPMASRPMTFLIAVLSLERSKFEVRRSKFEVSRRCPWLLRTSFALRTYFPLRTSNFELSSVRGRPYHAATPCQASVHYTPSGATAPPLPASVRPFRRRRAAVRNRLAAAPGVDDGTYGRGRRY